MNWWQLLGGVVGWQAGVRLRETLDRTEKYRRARKHADRLGRPLLVVGGPLGTNPLRRLLSLPTHGWGDVCLDIESGACWDSVPFAQADVRDIPFPDNFFGAAFASHILEHLPTVHDCELAISELARVADQVFIACPSKQSIINWLAPSHHLWVWQEGDSVVIEQRRGGAR